MKTHYDTLGLKRSATAADVKSAYRKIVLAHHPDRSKDPKSPSIFMAATEAYDVLSDPQAKLRYDESLDAEAKRAQERVRQNVTGAASATKTATPKPSAPRPGWSSPNETTATVAADVQKLTVLFARGRHAEAERLARQVINVAPKSPVPYAVLGDIARLKGDLNEAAKCYAYAAQYEPNNPIYQRRYEELLSSTRIVEDQRHYRTRLESEDRRMLAPMAGMLIVLAAGIYLVLSREQAVFAKLSLISTWTLGLPIMLFLSGIAVGASLAMGNLLDRFQSLATTATGRTGPAVTLAIVAVANFWGAAVLYMLLGVFQRAFNFSMTRLLAGTAVVTLMLALFTALGTHIEPGQVIAWGGNLVYLGALAGWLVADSFRG